MRQRLLAPVAIAFGTVACESSGVPEPERPLIMAVALVGGDGQSGLVNEDLPGRLVVQITGYYGVPRPGVLVYFRPTPGSGATFDDSRVTDEWGIARAGWILGPTPGLQKVQFVAFDPDTQQEVVFGVFRATGLAPPDGSSPVARSP